MQLTRYPFKANNNLLDYTFISSGPMGNITKVVRFSFVRNDTCNLAFGDLNLETGEIDDMAVTDNKDSKTILATIAFIAMDFIKHHPDIYILIIGNTKTRMRLYRRAITMSYKEIRKKVILYGMKNNEWISFDSKFEYEAFLLISK
jgi:hypothetical protein